MSTKNERFVVIIARLISSSGGRHGYPTDNTITNGMIDRVRGKSINRHGCLANNASSSHGDPANSMISVRKPKTVYVGNTQYHISIIKLAGVL